MLFTLPNRNDLFCFVLVTVAKVGKKSIPAKLFAVFYQSLCLQSVLFAVQKRIKKGALIIFHEDTLN